MSSVPRRFRLRLLARRLPCALRGHRVGTITKYAPGGTIVGRGCRCGRHGSVKLYRGLYPVPRP